MLSVVGISVSMNCRKPCVRWMKVITGSVKVVVDGLIMPALSSAPRLLFVAIVPAEQGGRPG